jgi:hypothetical protein
MVDLWYICVYNDGVGQRDGPAGARNTPGPGPQKGWHATVDTRESSAPHAHPSIEEQNQPDEAPHVCNDGWVTIGHIVADPETGEEVEEYALYLCRRCNA